VTTGATKGAEVGFRNSARQLGVSLASCSEGEALIRSSFVFTLFIFKTPN